MTGLQGAIFFLVLFGATLLALGSSSMLVVRWACPGLLGLGSLSASFALGSLGAGLLLWRGVPFLSVLLADVSLLASFALLHLAVLRLVPHQHVPFWHGFALISAQVVVDLVELLGISGNRPRVVTIGVLVAVQAGVTVTALKRFSQGAMRAPAVFCSLILGVFALFNLLRSGLLAFLPMDLLWHERLSLVAFSSYLAVALGLAFGFFWMTTAKLTAEAEHAASTDPLTRVYNRRTFLDWCEKELRRSQQTCVPFSLLMVDLDHFKCVNDNFGHHRGDEVLVAAVERMQDSVRGIDVLCRWGGEEFAVLLPDAPVAATYIVAERIRDSVERMDVSLGPCMSAAASTLTVSIGAATYHDVADTVAGMLARADRALYQAKSSGRNRVSTQT